MIGNVIHKAGFAIGITAAVATIGGIATVSAAKTTLPPGDTSGYTKDQCKDGGWMNFKNPDGSLMFKNQGQCVSFFARGGQL